MEIGIVMERMYNRLPKWANLSSFGPWQRVALVVMFFVSIIGFFTLVYIFKKWNARCK